MEDTLFNAKEIIKVCKIFKARMGEDPSADYRGWLINLSPEEKQDPELLKISRKAANFVGDEWDFIHALMGSPGFDDIMEAD